MQYTDDYSLKKPERGVEPHANIDDLNDNFDVIDRALADDRHISLRMYDPTSSTPCNTGDIRGYENPTTHRIRAYRCLEDNVTGPWDATKWAQTTLAEEIENSGGGGGSSTFAGLSDVSLSNLQNGQVPQYNSTSGKWENANSTGGASELSDLDDVSFTTPTEGQILEYDGDKWVNANAPDADVTKTATGNPIEISDGANAPLVKCVTEIQGSQDLHGYDKPWVGGAGKNKLPLPAEQTINGVTLTYLSDGGIKLTGSPTDTAYFDCFAGTFDSTTYAGYVFKVTYVESTSAIRFRISQSNRVAMQELYDNTVISDNGSGLYLALRVASSVVIPSDGIIIYPMLISSSETDYDFAPYSNICPITAYTEGEIEVRGKNLVKQIVRGYVNSGTNTIQIDNNSETVLIKVVEGVTYTLSSSAHDRNVIGYAGVDTLVNGTPISNIHILTSYTWTAEWSGWTAWYINSSASADVEATAQVEKGSTATTYEPYTSTTHTTTYPSAIYRGSEDVVNGEVTSEMVVVDLGSLTWGQDTSRQLPTFYAMLTNPQINTSGWYSNVVCEQYFGENEARTDSSCSIFYNGRIYICDSRYTDATTFGSAVSGVKLAYELTTPTTSSVTPTNLPVKSLSGYTHIESSTGEMEIEYITGKYSPLAKGDFKGATASLNGESGLVPAPSAGDNTKFLRGDGAWQTVSGGGGSDYSTTEQYMGKWVDGSDYYKKTFYYASLIASRNDWALLDTFALNKMISHDITGIHNNRQVGLEYVRISHYDGKLYYTTPELTASTNVTDVYVTILYTKPSL